MAGKGKHTGSTAKVTASNSEVVIRIPHSAPPDESTKDGNAVPGRQTPYARLRQLLESRVTEPTSGQEVISTVEGTKVIVLSG